MITYLFRVTASKLAFRVIERLLADACKLVDNTKKVLETPVVIDTIAECFRALRNSCAGCRENQDFIRSALDL